MIAADTERRDQTHRDGLAPMRQRLAMVRPGR